MSASQLLRILKTLPAGAAEEISAFNTDDELEASINRTSRCTNPFLSNEDDNHVDFFNNQPELESSTFRDDFTNNHEADIFKKSPLRGHMHPHLQTKTTGFRIDKHSVEYELPELIVCYKDKESEFHVKDICIDEGIPDEETSSVDEDDDDMIEASLDTTFHNHEWLRSSTMACCYMDVELNSCVHKAPRDYGVDKPTHTSEEKSNLSTNLHDDASTDQLTSSSMISLQDWTRFYDHDIHQHSPQGCKDSLGKRATVGSVVEKLADKEPQNMFNKSKIEESDTFHFDTRKKEQTHPPSGVVDHESIYELPLDSGSVVNQQDVTSDYKVAIKDHGTRYVVGETSFSMAGVISELISCARPMPFPGGISTRSDSSAASATSFAFPTLDTEYTSSPARMGKSERKRLEKHTGWRKGLLCCKF